MTMWVALLRGVNVGGATVRNSELTELFSGLGFADVTPVLASGNVRFSSEATPDARREIASAIEAALSARFDYQAHLLLVTREELSEAIADFPYDASDPDRQPWVIFCDSSRTSSELLDAAENDSLDPVAAGPGVVYWNPPKGQSTDTPFAKLLARKTFKARTTNRNLRTLQKILG